MPFSTLTVAPGVELAYSDSGAPDVPSYTTIFAVHGMCFTNRVFEKLQSLSFSRGYRFVAINRRPFRGSTPFSNEEINLIIGKDDNAEKRASFVEARGHEMANFIDIFSQKFGLPSLSADGKTGGNIIFGWSMGSQFAAAAIAYIPTLPQATRSRLASRIRSLIIYDPAPIIFGLPTAEKNWAPLVDTTMPEDLRLPMFGQWVSGYFDNGDYSKHDHNTLAYVLPSTDKVPTIFKDGLDKTPVYDHEASLDLPMLFFLSEGLKTTFTNVFGGPEVAALLPRLKRTFICADRSPSFAIDGMWAVQKAIEEAGAKVNVDYKIMKGANHFLHWEEPEKVFELLTA